MKSENFGEGFQTASIEFFKAEDAHKAVEQFNSILFFLRIVKKIKEDEELKVSYKNQGRNFGRRRIRFATRNRSSNMTRNNRGGGDIVFRGRGGRGRN